MIYDDLFDILSTLYDEQNLRVNVLQNIEANRKYYIKITENYFKFKNLEFVDWFVNMPHNNIPVDEICLHACGIYLNLHITLDYHFGLWTTLDIPEVEHNLAVILSNVHLVYRG